MEANPAFFKDLAYVFVAAIAGGMLAWKLRQPVILGYVLAGMLVGPFTPGPRLTHFHTLELFAEIGVILLMFSVGLEFSIKDLLRVRWVALIGGPLGILLSMAAGIAGGHLLGWPMIQGFVVGSIISVASTMVLTRLLIDRGELSTEHGRVMVGITLVEDLAVVILIVLLPNFGSLEISRLVPVGIALGKALLILVPALLIAAKIVPPVLRAAARTRSAELFFGVVLAICLGTAALTEAAGLSLALGAFAAGLMISESDYAHEALAQVFPLRDSFVALFFVTIGALIDPKALFSNLPQLLMMVGLIVIGKFLIWGIVVRMFGYSLWSAIIVGVGLTQIGEFSFILVQVARNSGLVGTDIYNATLAASLITILLNAALVKYVLDWVSGLRLKQQTRKMAPQATHQLQNHVVLCGFGRVGSMVGTALDTFQVPYVVIEVDPDIVETLLARGVNCTFGDATHAHILEGAHVDKAALVILTLPEAARSQLIIGHIRKENPNVPILARAHTRLDQEALLAAGASEIIQPEVEASVSMIRDALDHLKLPREQTAAYLERFKEAVGMARAVPSEGLPFPEVYEFKVSGSPLVEQSLREAKIRERFGVTVVAVRKNSGEMLVNPSADTVIHEGDSIRVFGLRDQIDNFAPAAGASMAQ